jgi:soluble lytic murein transglycosylase-like protein
VKLLPAGLLLCLATALPAEAQIYSWRDPSGTLVVSNKPRVGGESETPTYAVHGTPAIRATADALTEAARRYDHLIRQYAGEHGVSVDLVRAVIQAESAFNPWAVSAKGAIGLMQLMPATARELGVTDPFHPAQNIRGGVTYLARLLERYDQDVQLALAAYNAGPGSVERYGNAVPPYRETQAYVKKITGTVSAAAAAPPPAVIYKWTELINGRATVRYSNVPPEGIAYEIVGKR